MLLSLAGFPALATALAESGLSVAGAELDLPFATRLAFWFAAVGVVLAGMISRKGLRRGRLARPRPLGLLPRLRRIESDGKLIAFEGVEGSGKGTQIELASRYLEDHGYGVIVTREPGGTEFGDRLRSTILDPTTGKVDARAEALVFAASRAHLVSQVIRPALVEGKIVLCDRFVDSSVAYQGFARGVGEQDVLTLNAWATQGLFPDLVILLNIDPEVGLARARGQADRIEAEDVSFFTKVSEAYLRIAEEHPDRFVVVDATGTPAAVHARVIDALGRLLAREDVDRSGAT
jgi:dTMP kinase